MKIRVLKVCFKKTDDQKNLEWKWMLNPEGLDDLEIKAIGGLIDFKFGRPDFSRWEEMIIRASSELARRLGHELVFDQEFTPEDDPIAREISHSLYYRDTLGWLDFRHGEPRF
jgi:hypothetical protein